jgi:hypothetical protein
MKSTGKLFVVFGIIFGLIIGFFIGIAFNLQKVDKSEVSGTIAKINNYKNIQEGEIQMDLKSELLSDTVKLQSMQKYFYYYYATTAKMEGDVRFAINEANAIIPFRNLYNFEITALATYCKSLSSARTDLLLALRGCLSPEKTDPLLFGELLNQANSSIARLNFRNRAVLNFMDILASYTLANKSLNLQGLNRARNLLTNNELNTAFHTSDKILMNASDQRQYLTDDKNREPIDSIGRISSVKHDLEKLAALDSVLVDRNGSANPGMNNDREKLSNYINDSERFRKVMDTDAFGRN